MATIKDVQDKLTTLQSSVEGETDLTQAIVTLVEGQTTMIGDLKEQLAAAIASNDPAALQAVVDSLGTIEATNTKNAQAIADAVVKGTPAEASAKRRK